MTGGPLGRDMLSFQATMEKYHAEIERLVYAAEIQCKEGDCKEGCPFNLPGPFQCILQEMRDIIGDHVEKHDIPQVPP
jgi:hypothetical protein